MTNSSKSRSKRQSESVTGRDGYLIRQALAYTILSIEALPDERQEVSNMEDMKLLLDHLCTGSQIGSDHYLDGARWHLFGIEPPWQQKALASWREEKNSKAMPAN